MPACDLAAIVFALVVALSEDEGRIGRGTGYQTRQSHLHVHRVVGQQQVGAAISIVYGPVGLQIPKPNTMAEIAGVEIQSQHVVPRDVFSVIQREARASIGCEGILKIAEPVKSVCGLGDLIIRLCHEVGLSIRRCKRSRRLLKWRLQQNRHLLVLQIAL